MSDRGGGRARRRDHALWFLVGAVVIAAVVLVVAMLVGHGRDAPAATRAPCPGADGRARDLRPCLAESVAYVETPSATGSALLISDGYLVTNAWGRPLEFRLTTPVLPTVMPLSKPPSTVL